MMIELQHEELRTYDQLMQDCMDQMNALKQRVGKSELSQRSYESVLMQYEDENSVLLTESTGLRKENAELSRELSSHKNEFITQQQRLRELEQALDIARSQASTNRSNAQTLEKKLEDKEDDNLLAFKDLQVITVQLQEEVETGAKERTRLEGELHELRLVLEQAHVHHDTELSR